MKNNLNNQTTADSRFTPNFLKNSAVSEKATGYEKRVDSNPQLLIEENLNTTRKEKTTLQKPQINSNLNKVKENLTKLIRQKDPFADLHEKYLRYKNFPLPNLYKNWTPRLLKSIYDYNMKKRDLFWEYSDAHYKVYGEKPNILLTFLSYTYATIEGFCFGVYRYKGDFGFGNRRSVINGGQQEIWTEIFDENYLLWRDSFTRENLISYSHGCNKQARVRNLHIPVPKFNSSTGYELVNYTNQMLEVLDAKIYSKQYLERMQSENLAFSQIGRLKFWEFGYDNGVFFEVPLSSKTAYLDNTYLMVFETSMSHKTPNFDRTTIFNPGEGPVQHYDDNNYPIPSDVIAIYKDKYDSNSYSRIL